MKEPHEGYTNLATFRPVSFDEAEEKYGFDDIDDAPPDGYNVALDDIFGESPEEVFVHKGTVQHPKDLSIGSVGDQAGVYVIHGDLDIGGLFQFRQVDGGAVLLVTGSLRARSLSIEEEAQLWVGKDLEVTDYILAGVSDAGGLAVKGRTTAKAIIVTDSETIAFGKKPKARVVELSEGTLDEDEYKKVELAETALVAPHNSDEVTHEALVEAVRAGKRLLADEP